MKPGLLASCMGMTMVITQGCSTAPGSGQPTPIVDAPFGTVDGKAVRLYTLTNTSGMVMKSPTTAPSSPSCTCPVLSGTCSSVMMAP